MVCLRVESVARGTHAGGGGGAGGSGCCGGQGAGGVAGARGPDQAPDGELPLEEAPGAAGRGGAARAHGAQAARRGQKGGGAAGSSAGGAEAAAGGVPRQDGSVGGAVPDQDAGANHGRAPADPDAVQGERAAGVVFGELLGGGGDAAEGGAPGVGHDDVGDGAAPELEALHHPPALLREDPRDHGRRRPRRALAPHRARLAQGA
mmetsp:Transcript_17716/g.57964  ORF Transcript_17716/g.57964 Transcript_17716/m.57964 type:complete len:205 (+) Transcript_17716:138-752(+)